MIITYGKKPEKSCITIVQTRDLTDAVENINGLIRRFFPKGTDFDMIKHKDIKRVENWINNRPMKILNYMHLTKNFKNLVLRLLSEFKL